MMWKIYFWAYVILCLLGAVGYLENYLTMNDVISLFLALFIGMGIYSYAYNKNFFSPQVWAIGFYFIIIGFGLEAVYKITELDILSNFIISKYIIGTADLAVTSVLIVPALFALWILSHQKKSKSSKNN